MRTIVFLIVLGQLFQSFYYVFLVARGKSVRVSDIIFAFVCCFCTSCALRRIHGNFCF